MKLNCKWATSSNNVDIVTRHIERLLLNLGASPLNSQETAFNLSLALLEGVAGRDRARRLLEESCLRDAWNVQLEKSRAQYLAHWLAPHLRGQVLDLLCGDGAVGKCIAKLTNLSVHLVERPKHYGSHHCVWHEEIEDFDRFIERVQPQSYDTVLLCAVLHHEEDPEETISLAMRCARRRVVIVENCIEQDYPRYYQQAIDFLFNQCLNVTRIPCPGQHRTADEWSELLRDHIKPIVVGRSTEVPGIPLAHTVLIIDSP